MTKPTGRPRGRPRLGRLTITLDPADLARVEIAAWAAGVSPSEWVRARLVESVERRPTYHATPPREVRDQREREEMAGLRHLLQAGLEQRFLILPFSAIIKRLDGYPPQPAPSPANVTVSDLAAPRLTAPDPSIVLEPKPPR